MEGLKKMNNHTTLIKTSVVHLNSLEFTIYVSVNLIIKFIYDV
jgi:hypothetical protein